MDNYEKQLKVRDIASALDSAAAVLWGEGLAAPPQVVAAVGRLADALEDLFPTERGR